MFSLQIQPSNAGPQNYAQEGHVPSFSYYYYYSQVTKQRTSRDNLKQVFTGWMPSLSLTQCQSSAVITAVTSSPTEPHRLPDPPSEFSWRRHHESVSWSLTSLFSTNMAISETRHQESCMSAIWHQSHVKWSAFWMSILCCVWRKL